MGERSIPERVQDVDLVEQVIDRIAENQDEAAAMRRVLGVQQEADALALAYSPEPPLPEVFKPQIDHIAHTRYAIDRYTEWVDAYPDDDPTPLRERQRALRLAHLALKRLESQ